MVEAMGSGRSAARSISAFFDELSLLGVRHVVVAPGSRSTPLAMVAYELARRNPDRLRVHVDADERGAAFFALGIGKATGAPACVVCTSGTAVANFYPAVMEAASSRVPLIVLTGDRPARLQGLGAPQTCDQLNAYGNHAAAFRQMPALGASAADARFARQAAREAMLAAGGGTCGGLAHEANASARACAYSAKGAACPAKGAADGVSDGCGAPVHFNFPFDEPLTPRLDEPLLFDAGRSFDEGGSVVRAHGSESELPRIAGGRHAVSVDEADEIARWLVGKRVLVFAGEGSVRTAADAQSLFAWARSISAPIIADPLSNLRSFDEPLVIDNYDNVFARADWPHPDAVVRFGRWPVSKRASSAVVQVGCGSTARPMQIVVDRQETRDFNASTDVFVASDPWEFVQAMNCVRNCEEPAGFGDAYAFAEAWIAANGEERARIEAVDAEEADAEGAFVRAMIDLAPEGSLLFSASSMAVRAIDTFYTKSAKSVRVLCNRGLNGIDGTVSSAVGASLAYEQTTLLIGDLAMLHDLNALALQRELVGPPAIARAAALEERGLSAAPVPSLAIVLLNNNGGAIFDMLPQQSEDAYFERLFLTPQDVSFADAARAFGVPHCAVRTVSEFRAAYKRALGVPGISIVEVALPREGVKERYGRYW